MVVIGLTVIGLLATAWLWLLNPGTPAESTNDRVLAVPANSVAVLPFDDLSESANYGYFADGIADEILNSLARVRGIHVADTLGVATVLQGSVRISGSQLRVTAQLIDATNGFHIWSGDWERMITDVFTIQDEIAAAVVESLQVELLEDLAAARRTDPEAYALYLRSGPEAWRFVRLLHFAFLLMYLWFV